MKDQLQIDENRKLLLRLCFDGSAYHGWQVQKNAITVQQLLQDALMRVFGTRPDVIGCSRTDAGVHANDFCCSFETGSKLSCEVIVRAINAYLPFDIAVKECFEVENTFHARYDTVAKEYIYKILDEEKRNPFLYKYSLHYSHKLDCEAMYIASRSFLGEHDFTSFCSAGGSVKDMVRNVMLFEIERQDNLVILRIRADGFLYNMVRIMVGTLLYVSAGRIFYGDVANIITAHNRTLAGPTAPAHGLYLDRVFYKNDI